MTLAGFILYAIGGAICWAFPANMTVIAVAMVGICTGIFNGLLGHAGYIAPEIVNGVTVAAEQSAAVKGVITFGFVRLEVFTGVILAALLTFFPEIAPAHHPPGALDYFDASVNRIAAWSRASAMCRRRC